MTHSTEVRPVKLLGNPRAPHKYRAVCQCNWRGPVRQEPDAAHDDGVAHELAENEQ